MAWINGIQYDNYGRPVSEAAGVAPDASGIGVGGGLMGRSPYYAELQAAKASQPQHQWQGQLTPRSAIGRMLAGSQRRPTDLRGAVHATHPGGTVVPGAPTSPQPQGAIGGIQNDPRYAGAVGSYAGGGTEGVPNGGGSWMTGDPSKPKQWVPDGMAIGMGGGQSTGTGGGTVGPQTAAPYVPPGPDPNDPFSGFRVEPMDPRFSQTQAAQVTPGGIADLMNPYLQSVRDQTMTDIERQRQLAQMTTDDQANAAKAFGQTRHGVSNALTNDAFARQSAQAYANLNAQGFNAASGLATQNAGLAQQAGLSNAANYMSGRGQDITQNQAFMNNALAQRGQDIGQDQFNANLGLQQRGQDIGWNLGQMGQQLNAYNVAGGLLNSSGNMDWNSLNQANTATSQPGQSSTTTPGADPWNTLVGGLITGWGLTRP